MKTAVSLPDDLYRLAEAAARKLKMSRSELYAAAISEFLARQAITERLNEIYAEEPAKLDPSLHSAQLTTLTKDSW